MTLSPYILLGLLFSYFGLLFLIARLTHTQKETSNEAFFMSGKPSKWYVIAFGMIGTSISGITFISVPGKVSVNGFSYYQFILGNVLGFLVVMYVLLPLYYRLQVRSIYAYIGLRFSLPLQRLASVLFLIARTIGSAARLYLVLIVLQYFIFSYWHIPFELTAFICLLAIWAYTIKGGLQTIIWTDTLQTFFLLLALVLSFYFLLKGLHISLFSLPSLLYDKPYTKIFYTDSFLLDTKHVLKNVLGGMVVTIAMVGLDQDLMQKNLSLSSLGKARKNMFAFVLIFVVINFLFLIVGALLKVYMDTHSLHILPTDTIYPTITLRYLGLGAGLIFMLGLTAATFSTTDSALTALTTSFCVDILQFSKQGSKDDGLIRQRKWVHTTFCGVIFLVCLLLHALNNQALVDTIFLIAGYTYAPLLALYGIGMCSNYALKVRPTIYICFLGPLVCYALVSLIQQSGLYVFGFEVIVCNALLCWAGLWVWARKPPYVSLLDVKGVRSTKNL